LFRILLEILDIDALLSMGWLGGLRIGLFFVYLLTTLRMPHRMLVGPLFMSLLDWNILRAWI
jgi:hypothetical protein